MARTEMNKKSCAGLVIWMIFTCLVLMSNVVNAERLLKDKEQEKFVPDHVEKQEGMFLRVFHFLWQGGKSSYQPVWPVSMIILISLL